MASSMGAKAREDHTKKGAGRWAFKGVFEGKGLNKFITRFIISDVEGGKGGWKEVVGDIKGVDLIGYE